MEKKIYVLGGPGCGKSSLLYALTGEEAITDSTTSKVFARRTTTVEITDETGECKKPLWRTLLSTCFRCCCACLGGGGNGDKRKQRQPKETTAHRRNEKITLVFLEALEQEGRLRAMNYLDTDAVLLCFDVNTYKSLEDLKEKWLPEVNYYCPDEVPIILVGLKGDAVKPNPGLEPLLRRTSSFFRVRKLDTTQREAERLVNEEHMLAYVQCSAQDGRGLSELKRTLTKAVTTVVSRSFIGDSNDTIKTIMGKNNKLPVKKVSSNQNEAFVGKDT